jgi:hypothetical protein
MLGKLIAGAAGQQLAERLSGGNGATGALAGIATASIVRRLGPAGWIAALAGGYLLKKFNDKRRVSAVQPIGTPPYGAAAI